MANKNPMSTPEPWTMVAEGYATDTQPVFEQYCRKALEISQFSSAEKILDVACGPGTLSLLIHQHVHEVHSIDFAPGMLDCFNREIALRNIENISTYQMDGQHLEFSDEEFDWAFSIFGLMFFPDRSRGFSELWRTLRPGGRAVVTSWAPVSDSTAMQVIFGAMQVAFPRKPETDDAKVLTLEDPENFKHEMQRAGFVDVSITPFDGHWRVNDAESFFDSMVRGSAPITLLKSQLDEHVWSEKRALMLDFINDKLGVLPARLSSRAWIGVGRKQ